MPIMTTRSYTSTTILGPGTYNAWRPYDKYSRNSSGSNTPKELRLKGILLENNYDATITFERADPVDLAFNTSGVYPYQGNAFVIGGKPVPRDTIEYPDPYSLLGKLEQKWKNTEFNAGVTLGEGKESLDMMLSRLGGIYSAARALRKGNFTGALRELLGSVPPPARARSRSRMDGGDISGAWLELNLGWSPMLKDIFELADLFRFDPRVNRIRVRGKNTSPMRAAGEESKWIVEGQHDKKIQIIVECSQPPTTIQRLGLTDPASIAWELVPFSFVIDWFLPIGNSLSNMHALGSLPVSRVVYTTTEKTYGKSTLVRWPVAGMYPKGNMFHGYVRQCIVRRRIYDNLHDLVGTLGFLPKDIKPKWAPNLWKLATSAALVDQALRSMLTGHR